MPKLHVGIDVSLDAHHVQFIDERGQDLASFRVTNDPPGADTLIHRVLETAQAKRIHTVVMGMEAMANLGWHLAHYLKHPLQTCAPNLNTQVHVSGQVVHAGHGAKARHDAEPRRDGTAICR